MDGGEMLDHLIPRNRLAPIKKEIIERQGARYRAEHLPHVHAFPGVRKLFDALKAADCRIAIATTSQRDELDRYCEIMDVAGQIDAIACGSDDCPGKPHPDLIELALRRLHLKDRADAMMVGDTPYDAEAAIAASVTAIGTLGGHFSRADL